MAHGLEWRGRPTADLPYGRARFRVTMDVERDGEIVRKQVPISVPEEHCRTKTAARKYMEEYRNGGAPVRPSRMSFKIFAAQIIGEAKLKPSTRRSYWSIYRNHLRCLWHLQVQEITAAHCRGVLNQMDSKTHLGKPYSGRSKQAALSLLHMIMEHARSDEVKLRRDNPVDALTTNLPKANGKRHVHILTEEEADRLLTAAGEKYEAIVAVALLAGLRISEIVQLQWRHVDFELRVIRLEEDEQMRLKGPEGCKLKAANRDVGMTPRLVELLKAHRRRTPFRAPHHFVFCTAIGTPYIDRNLKRSMLDRKRDPGTHEIVSVSGWVFKAGLYEETKPIGFHVLRHNFGSRLAAEGADAVTITVQMGHDDIQTSHRYLHDVDRVKTAARAAEMIGKVFG